MPSSKFDCRLCRKTLNW